MATCTCTIIERVTSEGEMKSARIVGNICDFCTEMLWAAELEARLHGAETAVHDIESDLDTRIEAEIGSAIASADLVTKEDVNDYQTESDVESAIEAAVSEIDLDDYITRGDLADEVQSAIEDTDITKDAAAGAVSAVLRQTDRFVTRDQFETLARQLASVEATLADLVKPPTVTILPLTVRQRLGVLFTGRL